MEPGLPDPQERFEEYAQAALDSLPPDLRAEMSNVEIVVEEEPPAGQRLLGLYQGIPLSRRQGQVSFYPDRITLFKLPLLSQAHDVPSLREAIRHTLWHEIAHYYGLNHDQIRDLE